MSRRLSQTFRCLPLAELTRQLRYAPPGKRVEQARRAERLHDQIDPKLNYPVDFIGYRITGYRSERVDATLLVGEAILPDLRLMIDTLSRSAPIPDHEDDPVESVDQLAATLGVSTKTISRWRKIGLRWRWSPQPDGGGKRITFPRSGLRRFLDEHGSRVTRASEFTQVDPATRQRVIDRARRIVSRRSLSLNQVAAHLARKIGRAHETVRLILQQHDRQHPSDKIFVGHSGPLDRRQHRQIVAAARRGVPVSRIALAHGRTPSSIHRVIRRRRAAILKRMRIQYVSSPMFDREDADEVILRRGEPSPPPVQPPAQPPDQSPDQQRDNNADPLSLLAKIYDQPRLIDDQSRSLLVRFNYLKFKSARARDRLDNHHPRAAELDRIEAWIRAAATVRDRLVAAGMSTVMTTVQRHLVSESAHSTARLLELLEIGNDALVETINHFDPSTGRSFDSYLTWRLMQRYGSDPRLLDSPSRARRQSDTDGALARIQRFAARVGVVWESDRPVAG